MKETVLLICDQHWGRMRETALRLESEGVPSVLLVKVTPSPELSELIRMIPARPLIRQIFIPKKLFRISLSFRVAVLLLTRRIGRVLIDRDRVFHRIAPWLQCLGVRCELA